MLKMLEKNPEALLLFLRHFTAELILATRKLYPEKFKKEEQERNKAEMKPSLLAPTEPQQMFQIPLPAQEVPKKKFTPSLVRGSEKMKLTPIPAKPRVLPAPRRRRILLFQKPAVLQRKITMPSTPLQQAPPRTPEQQAKEEKKKEEATEMPAAMRKINALLNDRFVSSVECQGPGKPLLVKRAGRIQSTGIILREDEIEQIINYFSEKARIPVVDGMLKAAVENLLISAVVSEVVGSRFIITKQPYALIER